MDIELDQITNVCKDAQGYVIFAGVITDKRDKDGNNIIDFKYKRYHFPFEDTKKAVDEFQKAFREDVGV